MLPNSIIEVDFKEISAMLYKGGQQNENTET